LKTASHSRLALAICGLAAITIAAATPAAGVQFTCDTAGPVEVEATGGVTVPTQYPTLKAAFDAVNLGTHTGTIHIEVCGDTTETAPAVLNASGIGSASYGAVAISPVGAARTVSGNVSGPLLDLNGADNVTIDGRVGAAGTSNDLTIDNTNVAGAAIRLVNDASSNTVKHAILRSEIPRKACSRLPTIRGGKQLLLER
jgi:hypothetical protein